jgi:hypothetical protein
MILELWKAGYTVGAISKLVDDEVSNDFRFNNICQVIANATGTDVEIIEREARRRYKCKK